MVVVRVLIALIWVSVAAILHLHSPTHEVRAEVVLDERFPPEAVAEVRARFDAVGGLEAWRGVSAPTGLMKFEARVRGHEPQLSKRLEESLSDLRFTHDHVRRRREAMLERQRNDLGPPAEALAARLVMRIGARTKVEADPPVAIRSWWKWIALGIGLGAALVVRRSWVAPIVLASLGALVGVGTSYLEEPEPRQYVRTTVALLEPLSVESLVSDFELVDGTSGVFEVVRPATEVLRRMELATGPARRTALENASKQIRKLTEAARTATTTNDRYRVLVARADLEFRAAEVQTATVTVLGPTFVRPMAPLGVLQRVLAGLAIGLSLGLLVRRR